MKIVSWNVNSLRNAENFFLEFVAEHKPDIIFLQELRAREDQLSFFLKIIDGYEVLFNPSEKAGYSGTAMYYKQGLNISNITTKSTYKHLDIEGRYISCEVDGIHINNFYIPNGNSNPERYRIKLGYHASMLQLAKDNKSKGLPTVFVGDFNVAHTEIDLFSPKTSAHMSGFRPEERQWMDDLIEVGYIDTFREFHKEPKYYSWWNLADTERLQNKGWRLDYVIASEDLKNNLTSASILREVFGSDHCPVEIEIEN
jgi:exodeoxyribonuclease III